MSMAISRTAVRSAAKLPLRRAPARFESTASKATEAAKDTASKASKTAAEYKSKASDGLSRVSSAAGPAISGAAQRLSTALGKIGGRTGRLIAFVERQIPPTIYYARVGLELAKLVAHGQRMSPPPVSTFQKYFQRLVRMAREPNALFRAETSAASNPQNILSRVRNISAAELATGAVVTAEVLGFFTVGEMIGRGKIVGYRGDTGAHH